MFDSDKLTTEQQYIKLLVERYPYLLPRNVWTDNVPEDYDYSYMIGAEIPQGWKKLFLQLCEDIRQPLINANYLDKFRFSQVKEKYNRLCCYNFGAPEEVQDILQKYEVMSQYVCTLCGKPASVETRNYIASFCEDCWKQYFQHEAGDVITFDTNFTVEYYTADGKNEKRTISFQDEWDKYISKS